MSENYDAFISYRHAEFDDFVADTVQRELERFRLPSRISKRHAGEKKRRIERVFMDKNELALASDLSEAIYDALKSSEYLIVICTPRVLESKWCKKEIEFFIKEHGADHVLAVLAEGEPQDAFPDEITKRTVKTVVDGEEVEETTDVEPLAADVRGSSRREVKKKIRQEILRLAAVMFGCSYEDLRQRKREESLKRKLVTAIAITTVFALFGTFSLIQAAWIREQSAELEIQYRENLIKTAKLYAEQSDQYMDEGKVSLAIGTNIDAAYQDDEELPEEAKDYISCSLAEALGVYNNGGELKPFCSINLTSSIYNVSVSENEKYMMIFDYSRYLSVWSLDTYKCIYSTTDEIDLVYFECYNIISGDTFIYSDGSALHIVDLSEGVEITQIKEGYGDKIFYLDEEMFLTCDSEGVKVRSSKDGSVISQLKSSEYNSANIRKCYFDGEDGGIFLTFQNQNTYHILSVLADSLTVISDIYLDDYNMFNQVYIGGRLYLFSGEASAGDEDYSEYNIDRIDFGTKSMTTVLETEDFYSKFFPVEDDLVIIAADKILYFDTEEDKIIHECSLTGAIQYIYTEDEGIYICFSSGNFVYTNFDSFKLRDDDSVKLPSANYDYIFEADGKIITYVFNEDYMTVYRKSVSQYSEKTDATEFNTGSMLNYKEYFTENGKYSAKHEDDKINVYCGDTLIGSGEFGDNNLLTFAVSEDGAFLFVKTLSSRIHVYSVATMDFLLETEVLGNAVYYFDMGDYYLLNDGTIAYVYSKKTNVRVARVYGCEGYDIDENCLYIRSLYGDFSLYKVPFFSFDELLKMAEEQLD